MTHKVSTHFFVSDEVYEALSARLPVVALESTVITHGLPYPENRQLVDALQEVIELAGAVPATIAVLDGNVRIGVDADQIERLASGKGMLKISSREIGPSIARGWSGGTTVAATMYAAFQAGIRVFATGGIGGVHRLLPGQSDTQTWDVSADLPQLARTPMMVVCAGAKAILDLPATLEFLETWGIPVVGYQTDEFPAFYSYTSGLKLNLRADSAAEIVAIAQAHWGIGLESAILVANPPPVESALSPESVEQALQQALQDAARQAVRGQQVSPFLLRRMTELTGGSSLKANLALLMNNARLAAQLAREWVLRPTKD